MRAQTQPGKPHQHSHGAAPGADSQLLVIALALIVSFMIVEVVVAIIAGSLALLSDAGHMLTDAAAIAGSLIAIRLAARPTSANWTFGFKRAEILSAAVNGITLVVISAVVAIEAIRRLFQPPPVEGGPVLIVALLGVAVNLVTVWVLAKANRSSLNIEGSFQHILTDLYGFIATVIAGFVILFTEFTRADAIASLIVVVLMLRAAWGLLRDSGRILLEGVPEGVDLSEIRAHLMRPEHVVDVHDLHLWTVTSDLPALSAHVILSDDCFYDGHAPKVLDELQECLAGHFDVEHSTFQFEPADHTAHEHGADHR
ncbi:MULTISPECIES: cation diffusion facilitator family transporter [Humibacter]|nr:MULTISPECIES: cation diffusion facilitator family transporter [Humibacter]